MDLKTYKKWNKNETNGKAVFKLGADSGFFSEYNHMILAIYYCIKNRIQFRFSSKWANFRYKNGWNDFFEPFVEELNNPLDTYKFNERWKYVPGRRRDKFLGMVYSIYRYFFNVKYLTYELMPIIRKQSLTEVYSNDDLGLSGNLVENCRKINELVWKYNDETSLELRKRISKIDLPDHYISLHIRRGDKFGEISPVDLNKYIETAKSIYSTCKDFYVSTDDYSVFEELKKTYTQFNFYSLTKSEQRGYFQHEYESKSAEWRKNELLDFFASIEIMAKSDLYVGTLSSNVGMYMYWRMPEGRCIGVDFTEWKIW